MRGAVALAAAFMAASCGAEPDGPGPTCEEQLDELVAYLASLDRSCVTRDDCVFVGGADSCECSMAMPGAAINVASRDEAEMRISQMRSVVIEATHNSCDSTACGEPNCPCDYGSSWATCVAGECTEVFDTCLGGECFSDVYVYGAIVRGLDTSCTAPDDCAVAGGPQSCECAPTWLGDGVAVNAAALAARQEELDALASAILTSFVDCATAGCDSDVPCVCDVGTTSATCDQNVCTLVYDGGCPP